MKTRDEQEMREILKSSKADIAKMVLAVQRSYEDDTLRLRNEIAVLKAELAGRDKVFRLLELMAGESNLGLKVARDDPGGKVRLTSTGRGE